VNVNGGAVSIYNGSGNLALSAGPTSVAVGSATVSSGLTINGGASLTSSNQTGSGSLVLSMSPTVGTPILSGTSSFNRLAANQGTPLTSGDLVRSGWGTGSTWGTIAATDSGGEIINQLGNES